MILMLSKSQLLGRSINISKLLGGRPEQYSFHYYYHGYSVANFPLKNPLSGVILKMKEVR